MVRLSRDLVRHHVVSLCRVRRSRTLGGARVDVHDVDAGRRPLPDRRPTAPSPDGQRENAARRRRARDAVRARVAALVPAGRRAAWVNDLVTWSHGGHTRMSQG